MYVCLFVCVSHAHPQTHNPHLLTSSWWQVVAVVIVEIPVCVIGLYGDYFSINVWKIIKPSFINSEEIYFLTVTLVKAWDRSKNMSEAIIPGGREDIVPLAAFRVVPLRELQSLILYACNVSNKAGGIFVITYLFPKWVCEATIFTRHYVTSCVDLSNYLQRCLRHCSNLAESAWTG